MPSAKISHRRSLRGSRPIKSTSTRSEIRYAALARVLRQLIANNTDATIKKARTAYNALFVLAIKVTVRETGSSRAELIRVRCSHASLPLPPSKRGTTECLSAFGISCQWVNYFDLAISAHAAQTSSSFLFASQKGIDVAFAFAGWGDGVGG